MRAWDTLVDQSEAPVAVTQSLLVADLQTEQGRNKMVGVARRMHNKSLVWLKEKLRSKLGSDIY